VLLATGGQAAGSGNPPSIAGNQRRESLLSGEQQNLHRSAVRAAGEDTGRFIASADPFEVFCSSLSDFGGGLAGGLEM
jgi:hypothetical protein